MQLYETTYVMDEEFALHPAESGGMRITGINTLSPEGPLLIHKLIPLNDGVLLVFARGLSRALVISLLSRVNSSIATISHISSYLDFFKLRAGQNGEHFLCKIAESVPPVGVRLVRSVYVDNASNSLLHTYSR